MCYRCRRLGGAIWGIPDEMSEEVREKLQFDEPIDAGPYSEPIEAA